MNAQRIAIVGLGAIGGFLGARLALSGHRVWALARGATLAAVREHGLTLIERDGRRRVAGLQVEADPQALAAAAHHEPFDLLLIALKAPTLATLAGTLAPLIGPQTIVLPAMNGVPWWFLQTPPCHDPKPLAAIDPTGAIGATLPLAQTLGCVVHLTCSVDAPGVVRHGFGERVLVGEPEGGTSARVQRLTALLAEAGLAPEPSADVRRDIWFKLWGNMTMNPISALTGATSDLILDDNLLRAWMARAMGEAAAIGERIGCPITQPAEARMAVTRELGAFKTSMLQDAEAGRALELDALVGVVREIGARVGVATPNLDALFGLARVMGRARGLYDSP